MSVIGFAVGKHIPQTFARFSFQLLATFNVKIALPLVLPTEEVARVSIGHLACQTIMLATVTLVRM